MEAGYAVAIEAEPMAKSSKKKKPGFLQRWLLKNVKEAVDAERNANQLIGRERDVVSLSKSQPSSLDNQERAIRFTVHSANGGRVIETQRYDRQKDRHSSGLYVITSDQDFGREIDKIITMEALK